MSNHPAFYLIDAVAAYTVGCDNGNIIGAMMLARTPAFVFMAKRDISNCQVFKENLQSNRALALLKTTVLS